MKGSESMTTEELARIRPNPIHLKVESLIWRAAAEIASAQGRLEATAALRSCADAVDRILADSPADPAPIEELRVH